MRDAPTTRHSLLAKLSDQASEAAWDEFVHLYEPALYRFVRGKGLQDADAREIVQEVFLSVRKRALESSCQPLRHFRGWLARVATNHIIDLVRKRARQPMGMSSVDIIDNRRETDQASLALEVRHQMFQSAAARVQSVVTSVQWQAFWRTAVELQSVQRVATALNISVGNVYVCKCRVMERLRRELESMDQGAYSGESQ